LVLGVIPGHKLIEVALDLFHGFIEFLSERHLVELLLYSLLKFFDGPIGLWMPDLDPCMLDVIQMNEQFISMASGTTAVFWPVIAEHTKDLNASSKNGSTLSFRKSAAASEVLSR
jgi:hypothetical protein